MSFLVFLIVVGLAVMLVKLGALSVWVTVLKRALQVVAIVTAGIASYVGWRAWKRRHDQISSFDA